MRSSTRGRGSNLDVVPDIMWRRTRVLVLILVAYCTATATGAVLYVSPLSSDPTPPYSSWAIAATNIQDAIDAASAGDLVLVTNGIYSGGGRVVHGALTNRVVLDKSLTVESLNGPGETIILGYQEPGVRLGNAAVRCAYLTNGAVLSGFTLTNGASYGMSPEEWQGGGVWCESESAVVTNCVLVGCGAALGGAASGGTLRNCVLTENFATGSGGAAEACNLIDCSLSLNHADYYGGGAEGSRLRNCSLFWNSARIGGGANNCDLSDCSLATNYVFAPPYTPYDIGGGGANESTLTRCDLTANFAPAGGGVLRSLLYNCVLKENSATLAGGAQYSYLRGCTLFANRAESGGGAQNSTLKNCTLTGNSAAVEGGGALNCGINNSILYYNRAPIGSNYLAGSFNYCCTAPLPDSGSGNIGAEPQLAGFSHLSSDSPCLGGGREAEGVDLDGDAWADPPSIGCDEYQPEGGGPLPVSMHMDYTNVATGFWANLTADIGGRPLASRWNFGDGMVISNRPYATHAWAEPGDYAVVLTAYNEENAGGVSVTALVHVAENPVHYVASNSTNPVPPYSSWSTAARTIQEAVDSAYAGGVVIVSNGVYSTGGRAVYQMGYEWVVYSGPTNRVFVDKPLRLQSVNGPAETIIQGNATNGESAVRCVYLAEGTSLSGFTLTQGATWGFGDNSQGQSGGGVWCESRQPVVSNCWLLANQASYRGGAAHQGTLLNCTLSNNFAGYAGGGAFQAILFDCNLRSNVASAGGGAAFCDASNSVFDSNSAAYGGGASGGAAMSCTFSSNTASIGGAVYSGVLTNCMLIGNKSSEYSGGAQNSLLYQCAVIANSAKTAGGGVMDGTLFNCHVLSNTATFSGGGAENATLHGCVLMGNAAGAGGGMYGGSGYNCLISGNSGIEWGGGAGSCRLTNCTVTRNIAVRGGGVGSCLAQNCIVYYNDAAEDPNYSNTHPSHQMNQCCSMPLPPGRDNLTNAPGFIDHAKGNLRLQSNSACINSGAGGGNGGVDLDGNPRVVGGCVDIGAYEFQSPESVISYGWLARYGLPLDGSSDFSDSDMDGLNNWQEWRCGTDPTDTRSTFRLLALARDASGCSLEWESVTNRSYFIGRSTNLAGLTTFLTLATNIPGEDVTTGFCDTNPPDSGAAFYRVGVE